MKINNRKPSMAEFAQKPLIPCTSSSKAPLGTGCAAQPGLKQRAKDGKKAAPKNAKKDTFSRLPSPRHRKV